MLFVVSSLSHSHFIIEKATSASVQFPAAQVSQEENISPPIPGRRKCKSDKVSLMPQFPKRSM